VTFHRRKRVWEEYEVDVSGFFASSKQADIKHAGFIAVGAAKERIFVIDCEVEGRMIVLV
jgi:hypothetical protein